MARQSPSQRVATQAQRERALQRADEVGAAQAARELGLRASTVRAWRSRARPAAEKASSASAAATEAPVPPAEPDDIERLEQLLKAERSLAIHAMSESRKALQAGRTMDAQRTATVHGIASDKCERLEARLQQARAARVMLAKQQAQRIAQVITAVLAGLDIDHLSEVGTLVRDVLVQASTEVEVPTVTPSLAEVARSAVRDHLRPAIEQDLHKRLRTEAERAPRQLEAGPPPAPPHPDGAAAERFDEGHPASTSTDATAAAHRRAQGASGGAAEVVTGEVVEDSDGLDPQARQAWEKLRGRFLRPEQAQAAFRTWLDDREQARRNRAAVPWRPSSARVDFGHPGR